VSGRSQSRLVTISICGTTTTVSLDSSQSTFGTGSWFRCPRCQHRSWPHSPAATATGLRYRSQGNDGQKLWKEMTARTALPKRELRRLFAEMGFNGESGR
jgi:hypothetical protein